MHTQIKNKNTLGRRNFLASLAAGLSCAVVADEIVSPPTKEASVSGALDSLGLKPVGQVAPRPSTAIEASPLSVGFEVLDRQCFIPERTYPYLAQLGVKWARCQTGWSRCETSPGTYEFGWLDEVVDALLAIGIQPWFNLGYGNPLYTPDAPDVYAVGWIPVYNEAAMQAWLRFTKALAEHFASRVKHWEIWNEPNITNFWKPKEPNAADYVRFVSQTAPLIRQVVPGALIIGLACSGIKMEYIEACLDAGLAEYIDVLSYHPYRAVPEEGYDAEMAQLRKAIAAHGNGLQLWQGENGCPSKGGPESTGALSKLDWNEKAQAKWLLRRILTDLRHELPLTSYFHTVDLLNYQNKTNFKGLLHGADYTPKPAYFAYQCLCAMFDAKTTHVTLETELIGQQKVKLQEAGFVRDGHLLYAYWFPADLLKPWETQTIAIRLAFPEGAVIDKPVLIDPLTGKVYILETMEVTSAGIAVSNLPLLEYPLILANQHCFPKE